MAKLGVSAEQMTSVTRSGGTCSYSYAGTSQNEVLSETTPTHGSFALVYGRPDQQGQPVVEQVILNGSATGYVEHDPVSGQPLMLRTSSGIESLYVFDGTGNPGSGDFRSAYLARAFQLGGTPAWEFEPHVSSRGHTRVRPGLVQLGQALGGRYHVREQHRAGHRPDTARNR